MADATMAAMTRVAVVATVAAVAAAVGGCAQEPGGVPSLRAATRTWHPTSVNRDDLQQAVRHVRQFGLFPVVDAPAAAAPTAFPTVPVSRASLPRVAAIAGPPWTAILVSPGAASPTRVERGDTTAGVRVLRIWPDSVRVRSANGETRVLALSLGSP